MEAADEEHAVHAESLQPRCVLRHGVAAAADVCAAAYDAAQQTVALGLRDGRIQLFGGACAEATLASECAAPSRALLFLPHAPYLLRVSAQSELELFDLRTARLEASTLWPGEVSAICALPGSPFVLVGQEDGALSAACFRACRVEARAAVYNGSGAVVGLALQPGASDGGRVLIAHASGAVALFDLGSKAAVLVADAGDALSSAVWVDASTFATAHAGGLVRLWDVPEAAAPSRPAPPRPLDAPPTGGVVLGDGDAVQLLPARGGLVAATGGAAFFMHTGRASDGARTAPLVLPELPGGVASLVAVGGDFVLALTAQEPCLRVHTMTPGEPWAPLALGFPAASVTCAQVLPAVPALLDALHDAAPAADAPSLLQGAARRPPGLGAARLLATGHADGALRFSDASSAALPVLATMVLGGSVAALHLCPTTALCVACTARDATVFAVDGALARLASVPLEAPPLCVTMATAAALAVVGCTDGTLVLLDLPHCAAPHTLPLPGLQVPAALLSVGGSSGPLVLVLGAMSSVCVLQCATRALAGPCTPPAPSAGIALFALDDAGVPIPCCDAPLPAHPRVAALQADAEEDADDYVQRAGAADLVIVCSQDALRVHALDALLRGQCAPVRQLPLRTPATAAQLFVAPGGACVACVDRALTLLVVEAAALRPVLSASMLDIAPEDWAGDSASVFAAGLDGHVFSCWNDARGEPLLDALRLELLEEFSAPEPPPEPPVLWERSRVAAADADSPDEAEPEEEAAVETAADEGVAKRMPRWAGKLGGLRARATDALKRVGVPGFKQRKPLAPDDLDELFPRPPPTPLIVVAPHKPRSEDAGADRASLLGSQGAPGLRTPDDIRARYGRPPRAAAAAATSDVAGAMGENLQKLNERGEKLQNIQEKTARLESQASDFAASAKKLREQQEARTLFGLFS